MAGNFEYYAEMGLNAGAAISELSRVSSTAETTAKNLGALGTALDGLAKKKPVGEKQAEGLSRTLGLYQQLAAAVGAYGRSLKTINSTDLNNGVRKTATSLDHMKKALEGVDKTSKEDFDAKKRTLDLYKQMAAASKTQADTLRSEADAIKAVASAERTRQQTAQSAAAAATRGSGSTDMWGVSADERAQRQKANVVIQAEREMAAEFEKREQAQRKNANMQVQARAEMEKALATTNDHTSATAKNTQSQAEQERGLASTRYALYEVAAAYAAVSTAMYAIPVAGTRAAIEMEAQFAHVKRTTQAAEAPLADLREQFVQMSTDIPVAFEELSEIGTLGAQMGIATRDLESFTDTVAKFSATTNVSASEASTYFGRLANMLDDIDESSYRNLGAAVSELGTASVSTEKEILAVAESIATTANMAGFSADEVVGLSTAMASLRIRPEMARGAMQRIFAKINQAVGEGSEVLDEYANLLGVTADQAGALWRNDPSQFFMRVNEQLSEMDDNVARSIYMREQLQITNIRDVELLARLSNGYDTYASSMDLAYDAYERGDYLEKEAGVIFETTAAHLTRLAAAFKGTLAAIGGESLEPINRFVTVLIDLLEWIRQIPSSVSTGILIFGTLMGTFFALRASMALTIASLRAFRLIAQQTGGDLKIGFGSVVKELNMTLFNTRNASAAAATGIASVGAAGRTAAGGVAATSAAATASAGAIGAMGKAMRLIPWFGWASLAVSAAGAVWQWASASDNAATKAQEASDRVIDAMGGIDALQQAMMRDARELASGEQTKVYGELAYEIKEYEGAAKSASDTVRGIVLPSEEEHRAAVEETGEEYLATLGKIGYYTDQLMREAVASNDAWKEFTDVDIDNLLAAGLDFEELITTWQSDGGGAAAQAYIDGFIEHYEAEKQRLQVLVGDLEDVTFQGTGGTDEEIAAAKEQLANAERYIDLLGNVRGTVSEITPGLEEMSVRSRLAGLFGVEAAENMEEAFESTAEEVKELSDTFSALIDEIFGVVDAEAALYTALQGIGEAVADNGATLNTATEEGRANLAAVRSTIEATSEYLAAQVDAGNMTAAEAANAFAYHVEDLMRALEDMGFDPSEFVFIRETMDALFVDNPLTPEVDTSVAEQSLYDLAEYGQRVFDSLMANMEGVSGGARSGMAARGAALQAQAVAAGLTPRNSSIPLPTVRSAAPRSQIDYASLIGSYKAAQDAKNLADESEKAANSTKKQADEMKKAADESKKLREEIADAKDEGRIFEEIIKGLGEAFKDTLYQFNNFQSNRDSVESHLISMRDAAQQSAEQVRSLREEHRKLRQEASEDRVEARQAESFAAVARRYGDTERVVDYTTQAKGARESAREKDRLAREALKEADALNKNRMALTGYSEQAIKNRGDVRALQERMADLILAYAETGATTEQVTAYAEKLRRKFVDQLTQMGYNRRDAERLSRVFVQLKTDIDRIPRQVRIAASARVKEAEAALRNVARGRTATIDIKPKQNRMEITGNLKVRDIQVAREVTTPRITSKNSQYGEGKLSNWAVAGGGLIPGASHGPSNKDNRLVVGPNGPVGTIRTGEFVIRKPAVDAIGLNALHALNSMSPGAAAMSSAPAVNASRGIQLVELMPHQVHQLAQAVSTVLAVDGKVLAGTTNAQNTNAARRGVR